MTDLLADLVDHRQWCATPGCYHVAAETKNNGLICPVCIDEHRRRRATETVDISLSSTDRGTTTVYAARFTAGQTPCMNDFEPIGTITSSQHSPAGEHHSH